jgi:hypothetical protein
MHIPLLNIKILKINYAGPVVILVGNIWLGHLAKRSTGAKEALISLIGGSTFRMSPLSLFIFSPSSNPDQNLQSMGSCTSGDE